MNPANWPKDPTLDNFRCLLAEPVKGIENSEELGAGSFIFSEFRGIFMKNGFGDYGKIEDSTVKFLLKGHEIRTNEPAISRVDLYAQVLQDHDFVKREPAGALFFEIYLTQRTSNGVCESLGKLSNLIREGVRARMGILTMEANMRLHFLSPLEKEYAFFEQIRRMWIRCGGQQANCPHGGGKRAKRKETVDPIGNEAVKSLTSQSLAKKRKMALRLKPLLTFNV